MHYSYINIQFSYQNSVDTEMKEYIDEFFWNGTRNLFIYFEDMARQKEHDKESIQKLMKFMENDFTATLYAQTPKAYVKIEINKQQFNVYPLEPYCMKQGVDAREAQFDLDVYLKIALGFCENLPIYSLETKHLNTTDEMRM